MKESRLFQILYFLLERGHTTAPELAKRFEVSVRTIYRDLDALSGAGIPIYVTTGRKGGVQLLDQYRLDRSLFSDGEKREILAVLQSVAVSGAYERELLTKLSALFGVRSDSWFEVDFSRWGNGARDKALFETLKDAVLSRNAVELVYVNSCGERRRRRIYPLKLLYKGVAWYVKAYCAEKEDFRIFKLNRMTEVQVLEETFPPMEYPETEEGPKVPYSKITFRVPGELAYRVYDEFAAEEITAEGNGTLVVSCEMPEDEWLVGYLLSFGARLEVLEPVYLKEVLAEEGRKICEGNRM